MARVDTFPNFHCQPNFNSKPTNMSSAAKSVYYFAFYLYLVGLTLIFVPNFLLTTMGMPATTEVWIRVVGLLVCCIAYYYHQLGKHNYQQFFKYTVHARVMVFIVFIIFVLMKYVSPVLAGFGIIDLLGAAWTWSALRKASVSIA